ncbi:NAD-dependent epimerase/dehydratase family protein [Candidatus Pelagibacter sp.]|jgi:GDP-D-mannose 3', 5'-epimerase|nr:NAD-dependent epimerase/dehydratase family protein [Candidatus Pelagibacter sp.]|tara:strand:- start:1506 stop:2516 length:1011 start_codon:yes stop_codon:yes gene_type:complete
MNKNKKILVIGAGGFIAGHLIKRLLDNGNSIVASDIKPKEYWFQDFDKVENHYDMDMKDIVNCRKVTKGIDYVFNMACNMGGMGFIENNKAECMQSVLINTNLLIAGKEDKIEKYFFSSSACAYNKSKQQEVFIEGLKEEDAYPADPEDGYGWEKLFSERMCRHFMEDYGIQVRIARYHNIYGPFGTYNGGREKAPAALCRKVIESKINKKDTIQVWGDGKQTRTFLYVDDCVEGTLRLFDSDYSEPVNIGSDEQVSINQMIEIIENISETTTLKKEYQLEKPKGVRGRSSNNDLVKKTLNWSYQIKLKDGLKKTYEWIDKEISKVGTNISRFTKS